MNFYPAIDLKDGKCVRLLRGEMDKATVFSDKPYEQAKKFENAGCHWLHLVDLNGAFAGKPVNAEAVSLILKNVGIFTQLGGGIRDLETIEMWLSAGINRVILGTIALENPDLVKQACRLFPDQIVVGIDAKNGMVATDGWASVSSVPATTLAKLFEDAGVTAIIYTDINRDGAMQGPNFEETVKLAESVSIPIILSGGVSSLDDLKIIRTTYSDKIEGVIVGRALYDGSILPQDAMRILHNTH